MEESKRIRVVFNDDDILSESQKSDGLSRSWVLLKPNQHDTVSDIASHLLHAFQLHQSCPHGLILSISRFVLPPFESTRILKDDEIIRVQKRKDILSIAESHDTNDVEKLEAVGKQPGNSGILLLASEEFEKEKGGYESDEPEEQSEMDDEDLKDVEKSSGGNVEKRNRKRKASEKLQSSMGKKKRSDSTGKASNDLHKDKFQNSHQDADLTKKKGLSSKEKKDDFTAGASVQNNVQSVKLSDKSDESGSGIKRIAETQENSEEAEDAKVVPKATKKVPSRSARRKYAKRRWLREMAKIQKQNATCESEGLRNWKEDQAKVDRKKGDGQWKGLQKWKKHQADAQKNVADGQPKGLLHWKQSPQKNWPVKGKKPKQWIQNDIFLKFPNQNGDVHEQTNQSDGHEEQRPTQDGDGLEQPNHKKGDIHEQSCQEHVVQECMNHEQLSQESGEENEVVPIVIRPGHIRFEPSEKDQAVQKDYLPHETFQWNGITSKKKGQQWGKESRPFIPRNDYKTSNKEYYETLSNEKEKQTDDGTDFDKLPPLLGMPKKGDVIAYRILELSSSWTPELSAYRVGKVSWCNAESNQTTLVPVPEFPILSKKADEDEAVQPDNSLYKKDGSLEIDFSSLMDVRIFNNGRSEPKNEALRCMNEGSVGDANAPKIVLPSRSDKPTVACSTDAIELDQGKETQLPTAENIGVNIWDQLSESLNAKKEQLSQQNGWCSSPKKVQVCQKNIWGTKPSPGSDWGKNTHKLQASQTNSWGKQSSGSKSRSYKALRGSALGPTMAILRSKNEI